MKPILFITSVLIIISCKKKMNIKTTNDSAKYQVENFRKGNMNDYQTIMAAIDSVPENSTLQFANKTYTLDHTPVVEKSLHFIGPARITRENQKTYTLKIPASENSSYLVLNSTEGIIGGAVDEADIIVVCLDKTGRGATAQKQPARVSGDTLFLSSRLGRSNGGIHIFPAGTKVFKSVTFFYLFSPVTYPNPGWYPEMNCSFSNLTFDGNKVNNTGSYYWNINAAIAAVTKGTTVYKNCEFINSPNESIVGHNADIENCTFLNLNGSGFHTSADKENCTEDEIHSIVENCLFKNTNQVKNTITGHSEGAITHSNSGGYYTAKYNTFVNVGDAVIGGLYASVSPNDWGTSEITFTENTIDSAGRMVYGIDTLSQGQLHDIYIAKNFISNMDEYDYSAELEARPGIILQQETEE